MIALEKAIVDTEKALEAQTYSAASLSASRLDRVRWSHSLEAALGKPAELQSVKEQITEETLHRVSAQLGYESDSRQLEARRVHLLDKITQAIDLLDEPEESVSKLLKTSLQGVILRSITTHRRKVIQNLNTDNSGLDRSHCCRVLVSAFRMLSADLAAQHLQADHLHKLDWYPNVKLKAQRLVRIVPFEDNGSSAHPANAKLVELFGAFQYDASIAQFALRCITGYDEVYYTAPIIETLWSATPASNKEIEEVVERQNSVRIGYTIRRADSLNALEQLRLQRIEVAAGLLKAVSETEELLALCDFSESSSNENERAAFIAMNNCLAVDAYLRQVGHQYKQVTAKDLTDGKGFDALAVHFEQEARDFRRPKINAAQP